MPLQAYIDDQIEVLSREKNEFHKPLLSVVIPMRNEEESVIPMITAVMESLSGYAYEILLVDDGSTDTTINQARSMNVPQLLVVELTKNFGQTNAMAAGIHLSRGEYVVTIDGDLQNDPSDIPVLLTKAREGDWDVVAGNRANRQDGWLLRKLPSKIANALIRKLTGVYLYDYGCTLKVFRSQIAKNLGLYGELHRFIPVLASLQGGRIMEMNVKHHPRRFGKSKYGLGRTTRVMSDLLLMIYMQRWLQKPMHFFGTLGGAFGFVGLGLLIWQGVVGLYGQGSGFWALAGFMLLLSGLLFIVLGFIAEVQMRIYFEGSQRRPYLIRTIHGANVHSVAP